MTGLGATSNGLGWLFWSLAVVAVALRLLGSRIRGDFFRLDDYLMVFSLTLNLCGVVFNSVAIYHGLGQHIQDLNPGTVPKAGLWAVVADSFCLFGDVVPKLAVALLVNRILVPRPFMKRFHIGLTVLLNLFTVAVFLVSILQCNPVAHQWDPVNVPGFCLKPATFERIGIAEGALGSFVDLYFSLYPPIVISQLHMSLKKRIIAGVTMSLGLFTLFTTLYKTAAILPRLDDAQADITYILCQVVLWGLLESSVTIIAGSIPTWGWLFRTRLYEKLVSWTGYCRSRLNRLSSSRKDRDVTELSDTLNKNDATKALRNGGSTWILLDSAAERERSVSR